MIQYIAWAAVLVLGPSAARAEGDPGVLPQPASEPEPPPGPDAQAEWDRRYVGFATTTTTLGDFGAPLTMYRDPFQGSSRRPLDVPQFYEAVGDGETAARYRKATRMKWGATIPGIALTGAGAVSLLMGIAFYVLSDNCPFSFHCDQAASDRERQQGTIAIGVGVFVALVGLTTLVAATNVERPELTSDEARARAERFNRELRRKLRLPPIAVEPAVSPMGAGVAFRGHF